jgi:hypothetical protein
MGVNGESEETLQAGRLKLRVSRNAGFITFDFQPHSPQQLAKGKGRVNEEAEVPVVIILVD